MDNTTSKWTRDVVIAFECACKAIAHMIAIYSSAIHGEKKKPGPDMLGIAELENKINELAGECRARRLPIYHCGV